MTPFFRRGVLGTLAALLIAGSLYGTHLYQVQRSKYEPQTKSEDSITATKIPIFYESDSCHSEEPNAYKLEGTLKIRPYEYFAMPSLPQPYNSAVRNLTAHEPFQHYITQSDTERVISFDISKASSCDNHIDVRLKELQNQDLVTTLSCYMVSEDTVSGSPPFSRNITVEYVPVSEGYSARQPEMPIPTPHVTSEVTPTSYLDVDAGPHLRVSFIEYNPPIQMYDSGTVDNHLKQALLPSMSGLLDRKLYFIDGYGYTETTVANFDMHFGVESSLRYGAVLRQLRSDADRKFSICDEVVRRAEQLFLH